MKIEILNKTNETYLFVDELCYNFKLIGYTNVHIILEIQNQQNLIENFLNGDYILKWNDGFIEKPRATMFFSNKKNCFIYKWHTPNHTSLKLQFDKNDNYIKKMLELINEEIICKKKIN